MTKKVISTIRHYKIRKDGTLRFVGIETREAEEVKEWWGRKLPLREELLANWCGKVVAVVKYAASEDDWDESAYGWRLSGVKKLKKRIVCKGALKLWRMDAELAKKVLAQL